MSEDPAHGSPVDRAAPSTLGPPPTPGDRVGPYRLDRLLGMGATSSVHLAFHEDGRRVALKVLDPNRVLPEDLHRFTREFQALSRMDHPAVVSVYEAGSHQGYPWIAMEYVDGTDLGALVESWAVDPPPDRFARVERILRGLCEGLQYVHDLGWVHRDLKPGNVLVTPAGDPRISDFGVVRTEAAGHTQLTMAGRLVGTVAYMAPELITDEGVDRRADLYALGAVLYLLLTGRRPIEAQSVAGYLARHLTEVPRPAGEVAPGVPRRLERIAQRLLSKDRSRRYPSAQAVLQALDRADEPEPLPLRGRDPALARWSAVIQGLVDGVGGVLGLVGPPGSGRTRLLEHLVEQVPGTVEVRRASGPQGALVDALGPLDGPLTRPLVLAVDDLDRADPLDVEALGALAHRRVALEAEPLLLVFSGEDGEALSGLLSGRLTGMPGERLELEPLDPDATVAILRDRGITGPSASVLARRLHAAAPACLPGAVVQQLDACVEAGWFEQDGEVLRPRVPLEVLRHEELPLPPALEAELRRRFAALDPASRALLELVAIVDPPAPLALIDRCARDLPEIRAATPSDAPRGLLDPTVPALLEELIRRDVLVRTASEAGEELRFAHPCAASVVRRSMAEEVARARHRAVADALASRRRSSPAEVATHRERAGDPAAAYPLYLQAARRAARQGAHAEVLDLCRRAEAVREAAEPVLDEAARRQNRRLLHQLEGEALLGRGAVRDALAPLGAALADAREEGDPSALARCLTSLGRAEHRLGRYGRAEPLLVEALTLARGPERLAALRTLADVRLREGALEVSEALWTEALELAAAAGSRDAEARARRGLAHLRGVQGRLQDSGELFDHAEELLAIDGDPRIRAGVLARSLEIDTAGGRYGSALRKAEMVVELARRRALSERLPEAYALLAEALCVLGDPEEAHDAAQQALVFARAHDRAWDARLRAARVLLDLGRPDEAEGALPLTAALPRHVIDAPAAWHDALRGRLLAARGSERAAELARRALAREPALMALRVARTALDAALALAASGHPDEAREAVKRGLKVLHGPGADGIRLELLLAWQAASPEDRVLHAAGQVARRIQSSLAPGLARSFGARPEVAAALARVGRE